jgi:hypothetical protein
MITNHKIKTKVYTVFHTRVNCPYICFGFNNPSSGGPKFYMYYTSINSCLNTDIMCEIRELFDEIIDVQYM